MIKYLQRQFRFLGVKDNAGFTLLEVIVTLTIITTGLIGVMSLVVQNIKAGYINKNVLIASQLAQEGLELVRNRRDTNWLTVGRAWNETIGNGLWEVDYTGYIGALTPPNLGKLQIDNNGFYLHNNSYPDSAFSRSVSIQGKLRDGTDIDDATADYLDVVCAITWTENGQARGYNAATLLYNWRGE